eukprot:scaffold2022_cov261-Pinguiococcus_pyrenoidosus.AAC.7
MTTSTSWRIGEDGRVYKKGRRLYPNRDVYEGEFVNGLREGRGSLFFVHGDQYVGNFEENLFHGFGIMTYAPFMKDAQIIRTARYEGFWAKGRKCGRGLQVLGDGDSYEGFFENDLFEGHGEYTCKNGDRHVGEWARGKLSGPAKIDYANGDTYTGTFPRSPLLASRSPGSCRAWTPCAGDTRAGLFHGKGKFVWAFKR